MIETGIIDAIETAHALDPDGVCFYIASKPGTPGPPSYESVTFAQLRVRAARLARAIDRMDVHRGMWCVADMENCSAFVYLLVAAAVGGFGVVVLNTHLSAPEKADRLREIHTALCFDSLPVFDEQAVKDAIKEDMAFDFVEKMDVPRWMRRGMGSFSLDADAVAVFASGTSGRPKAVPLTWGNVIGSAVASNASLGRTGESAWQLALPLHHVGGMEIVIRSLLSGSPFILYRTFDAAQLLRDVTAFGITHVSVVDKMLHDMLELDAGQARRDNSAIGVSEGQADEIDFEPDEGAIDPVGLRGADPVALAAESDDPFDGIDPFDDAQAAEPQPQNEPEDGLDAAESHPKKTASLKSDAGAGAFVPDPIDTVDPFEQDELEHDGTTTVSNRPLARYQVILLAGTAPNTTLLRRAIAANARVYASYGKTETCGQIASRQVTSEYDGTLTPLPGYRLTVVAPDAGGYGQLAVKGPGVMSDYLNARARFTADGFFLTGDTARMSGRCVYLVESDADVFVSGGESVNPEEVRAKLLRVPGVTDAYVFGDEDPEWGKRPVAVVEAAESSHEPGFNLQLMTDDIRLSLASRLTRLYQPDHIIVVPEFPRTGIGKTDRRALHQLYEQRIDVRKVEIWHVKQPFTTAVHAQKAKLRSRESLLVRVTDWAGRTGVGEDSAFPFAWHTPETIDEDLTVLQEVLVPLVNDYVFVHPSQASVLFRAVDEAAAYPAACAALESALWDLYGKVVQRSVVRLIGGRDNVTERGSLHAIRPGCVPGGVTVAAAGKREVLMQVRKAVESGVSRVKLQVRPGHDLETLQLVHKEFPHLTLVLDAGLSFTEENAEELKAIDALGAACLVDPLDPEYLPKVGPQDFWARMVRLQRDMRTPLCLDACWDDPTSLQQVLSDNTSLRCVALRVAKLGGIQPTLEFYWWARERGISLWIAGSHEAGVAKRVDAVLSTLAGMNIPSDVESVSAYFARDVAQPPFELRQGVLRVNPGGYEHGLGCSLDERVLSQIYVDRITVEKR